MIMAMVIVSEYGLRPAKDHNGRVKENECIVSVHKDSLCPKCEEPLRYRGTCTRKVRKHTDSGENRTDNTEMVLHLRVLMCVKCKKTHRELPAEIIPYKRYGLELVCKSVCNESYSCETTTYQRIKQWVEWFILYAIGIIHERQDNPDRSFVMLTNKTERMTIEKSLCIQMKQLIQTVVNRGKWRFMSATENYSIAWL